MSFLTVGTDDDGENGVMFNSMYNVLKKIKNISSENRFLRNCLCPFIKFILLYIFTCIYVSLIILFWICVSNYFPRIFYACLTLIPWYFVLLCPVPGLILIFPIHLYTACCLLFYICLIGTYFFE